MKRIGILILLLPFFAGCKNTKQYVSEKKPLPTREEAQEVISQHEGWERIPNQSGEYILYVEPRRQKNIPHQRRDFHVVEKRGERVFEGVIYGGYVQWHDSVSVEYFSTPGVMMAGSSMDDFVVIYNVVSKESYTKSKSKF